MAAELVRAAKDEGRGEPERLRWLFLFLTLLFRVLLIHDQPQNMCFLGVCFQFSQLSSYFVCICSSVSRFDCWFLCLYGRCLTWVHWLFFLLHVVVRFSYYTAGTGGAGPTILSTSFLLLGEEVVAYSKGFLSAIVLLLVVYLITSIYQVFPLMMSCYGNRWKGQIKAL